jgi:hypothetical protein
VTERDALLAELRGIGVRMATVAERRAELSAQRLELYRAARAAGASLVAIGRAAGVSDVAVLRALQHADAEVTKVG